MKYRHLFSYRTIVVITVLLAAATILLFTQRTNLKNENENLYNSIFRSQMHEGFACGILTTKEAALLLAEATVISSGTIIDEQSPTASSRPGSPRLDSCSYRGTASNASYVDVVIKTYATSQIANSSYEADVAKVLFLQSKRVPEQIKADRLSYAAGVHYVLKQNQTFEISAGKVGASNGILQEQFSESVMQKLLEKL